MAPARFYPLVSDDFRLGLDGKLSRACQHPDNLWSLHGLHECLTRRGETVEAAKLTIRGANAEDVAAKGTASFDANAPGSARAAAGSTASVGSKCSKTSPASIHASAVSSAGVSAGRSATIASSTRRCRRKGAAAN